MSRFIGVVGAICAAVLTVVITIDRVLTWASLNRLLGKFEKMADTANKMMEDYTD